MTKIRVDTLLYEKGLFSSRERAKRAVMEGRVYVKEEPVLKAGDKYEQDTEFNIKGTDKYVSRGGYKLEKSISEFNLNLSGKICADFGASTGGFTDCMLQNNAAYIYSIDVGYGQLDYKIRSNSKVKVIERTNIRKMDTDIIDKNPDFISIDVSFISLTLILPKAFSVLKDSGQIVALIKPQFETTKEKVGKNGIVRDRKTHKEVICKVKDFVVENGFVISDITFSPITGAKGNIEYLALIEKEKNLISEARIDEIISSAYDKLR